MINQQAKEEVKLEIATLRRSAIDEANANKTKALANPKFRELDKQERLLTFDIAKKQANGENVSDLVAKLKRVKQEKKSVLNEIGLNPSSLVPQFLCKKCNDCGVTESGQCDCFKRRLAEKLTNTGNSQLASFESFKNFGNEKLDKIKKYLIDWAAGKNKEYQILLCGKTGVGKTYLAESTISECKRFGQSVIKVTAFKMNEIFTAYHTTFDNSRNNYLQALIDADVLMIDDLGTEPIKKNITREYLYLLLNERKENGKRTIITSNLDLEGILRLYEERIFSRIADKTATKKILIEGKDLRFN